MSVYMLVKTHSHGQLPLLHWACVEAKHHRAAACDRRGSREAEGERCDVLFKGRAPETFFSQSGSTSTFQHFSTV